ncbi:hypothetical protein [Mesorhizobium silamurunense]|uniref:hypothetical protein n=1 Tax=Mesorhizobium silamurunense TaxID=499528 RepID=UPI0017804AE4|nr:hypothetical protein [Mesorhizobium silamurunense]
MRTEQSCFDKGVGSSNPKRILVRIPRRVDEKGEEWDRFLPIAKEQYQAMISSLNWGGESRADFSAFGMSANTITPRPLA